MPRMSDFTKLLLASFVSQTGSHFLTLALSAFVFLESGSSIQAALVFVVSFLPSILVSTRLGSWIDRSNSRRVLISNDLIACVATLICGACIYWKLPLSVLCVVLGFRSILSFVGRASATKWIKLVTPPESQTARMKLFFLAFFLSTALSGALAGVILTHGSISTVVVIDVLTYLVGVGIFSLLPFQPPLTPTPLPTESEVEPSLSSTLWCILQMPVVRTSFLLVCFSQAMFQGAYSALVSYLPMKHFELGVGGVGLFQVAASVGIIGGFLVNWLLPSFLTESKAQFPIRAVAASALAGLSILACAGTSFLPVGVAGFLILNLAYECVWLHHSSEFFRASPKASAARYQFTLSACAAFLMAVATLGYSAAVQYLGLWNGVALVLTVGVVLSAFISLASTRRRALVPALGGTSK